MTPLDRLKVALEKVQQNGCEVEPKTQWFIEEYGKQVTKDAQQLNREHLQELEGYRKANN